MLDETVLPPAPVVVGYTLPTVWPLDFRATVDRTAVDGRWVKTFRGVHYHRSETQMRKMLAKYAREQGICVITSAVTRESLTEEEETLLAEHGVTIPNPVYSGVGRRPRPVVGLLIAFADTPEGLPSRSSHSEDVAGKTSARGKATKRPAAGK